MPSITEPFFNDPMFNNAQSNAGAAPDAGRNGSITQPGIPSPHTRTHADAAGTQGGRMSIPDSMADAAEQRRRAAIARLRTNPPAHLSAEQVQAAIDRLQRASTTTPSDGTDSTASIGLGGDMVTGVPGGDTRGQAFDSQGRPTQINTPPMITGSNATLGNNSATIGMSGSLTNAPSITTDLGTQAVGQSQQNRPSAFQFGAGANLVTGAAGDNRPPAFTPPDTGPSGGNPGNQTPPSFDSPSGSNNGFGGNIGNPGNQVAAPNGSGGNNAPYSGTSPGQGPTDLGMFNVNSTTHFQTNLDSPGPSRVMDRGRAIQQALAARNNGDPYGTGMFSGPYSPGNPSSPSGTSGQATNAKPGGAQPTNTATGGPEGIEGEGKDAPPRPEWLSDVSNVRDAERRMDEELRRIGSQVARGLATNEEYREAQARMMGELSAFKSDLEQQQAAQQQTGNSGMPNGTPDGMTQGGSLGFNWGADGGPEFLGDVPPVPGPTFWDVTGDELVEDRLASLFEEGSPVLEAYQNATERAHLAGGGQNSLMARQAGVAALSQMAFNIASQDAQTIARAREFNAAMSNQFGLAQQTFIYNALLSDQNFRQGMEMQSAQLAAAAARQAAAAGAAAAAQSSAQRHQAAMQREAFQHGMDMAQLQHGQAMEIMGAEYGLMMDRDTLQADLNLRNQYTLNDQGFQNQFALNEQGYNHQLGLNEQTFGFNSALQSQAHQEGMERFGYEANVNEWANSINFSRTMALQMTQTQINMLGMWTEAHANMVSNGAPTDATSAFLQDFQNMAGSMTGLSTAFFTNGANPFIPNYANFPPLPGMGG